MHVGYNPWAFSVLLGFISLIDWMLSLLAVMYCWCVPVLLLCRGTRLAVLYRCIVRVSKGHHGDIFSRRIGLTWIQCWLWSPGRRSGLASASSAHYTGSVSCVTLQFAFSKCAQWAEHARWTHTNLVSLDFFQANLDCCHSRNIIDGKHVTCLSCVVVPSSSSWRVWGHLLVEGLKEISSFIKV